MDENLRIFQLKIDLMNRETKLIEVKHHGDESITLEATFAHFEEWINKKSSPFYRYIQPDGTILVIMRDKICSYEMYEIK